MNVTLMKQTRNTNCGQTCVAMLTGKTIREIEQLYGHGSLTYGHEHVKAVNKLGCYADPRGFRKLDAGEKLPEIALVRIAFLKRSGGHLSTSGKVCRSGHLVLWANGMFYNPSGHTHYVPEHGTVIDKVLEVLVP